MSAPGIESATSLSNLAPGRIRIAIAQPKVISLHCKVKFANPGMFELQIPKYHDKNGKSNGLNNQRTCKSHMGPNQVAEE